MKILEIIEDNLRKYIFINRILGIYTNEFQPIGKIFGKFIGQGSSQDVFEAYYNPDKVLKIQAGYTNKINMLKGISKYYMRNRVPMAEKVKYIGYVLGPSEHTKGICYYPVFSQNKLEIPSNHTYWYWDKVLLPELEEAMRKNGINVNNHKYTYEKYSIEELSPFNVGKDKFGNWKFIDAEVLISNKNEKIRTTVN